MSTAPTEPSTTPASSVLSLTPSPSALCSPSGTTLAIAAEKDPFNPEGYSFDATCLAAPADTPFTMAFDNRDPEKHNIDILDHPGGTPVFTGEFVTGPKTITYTVDPLPAGTYYFRCDIHPLRMHGALVIGA